MGLILNVENVVKSVVSQASETATAVATATTTSIEKTASVFSATSSGAESTNTSSTTVILSEDYNNKQTKTNYEEIWITGNNGESMEKIARLAYGYNTYEKLPEGEKNSAAASIVDNNRWMIDNINETYLAAQVTQDVIGQLYPDGISDENMDDLEKQVGKLLLYISINNFCNSKF